MKQGIPPMLSMHWAYGSNCMGQLDAHPDRAKPRSVEHIGMFSTQHANECQSASQPEAFAQWKSVWKRHARHDASRQPSRHVSSVIAQASRHAFTLSEQRGPTNAGIDSSSHETLPVSGVGPTSGRGPASTPSSCVW